MRTLGANADIWRTADRWEIGRALALIAQGGFEGTLLYAAEGVAFVEKRAPEIARALKEHGLRLLQLHADWPSLIDADEPARSRALAEHFRWGELAGRLGAEVLVVHPTGRSSSGRYLAGEEAMEALAEGYGKLAKSADNAGVTLAVENDLPPSEGATRAHVGGRVKELLALCEVVGASNLGIC
ncbi:MAG: TIM barrel protein, partial [Planctomycetota bacterium]